DSLLRELKDKVDFLEDPTNINEYRPISLIGCRYKVIAKVLANRLQQVVHSVVSEVQTAYLKGRQIIDGPLMMNEIISWASKKKECLFLFKVDFEKAFDSLDWKFLDRTMKQMGFSNKWRKWIHGCLNSAYTSVLVNGSPTKEFKIQKGLRQGDPLSPFLFIIAMEALHVTLQEAKSKKLFEGVKVGYNKVDISHLQYADDALILGKWSIENAKNLCRILRCFHMSSRFTLIRSVLGALGAYYFSLFKAPKGVISYLERLRRNFFWGGSIDSNKLSWIAWKKVCSSKSFGGLGIGSLYASNIAMVTKWWWRFHKEPSSLWRRIIVSIHGDQGGIGDCNLQTTYPRLYMLESDKHCKIYERVNSLNGIQTTNWNWRWPIRVGPKLNNSTGCSSSFHN
nr:RNA-directed DNA polymerase, eukaryota, reverse transcriptase zinc-binding domain protein [Tanacetum cinerariifolium]